MKLVNLTPHSIVLQATDGSRITIEPSGTIARVSSTPGPLLQSGVPGFYGVYGTLKVPVHGPSVLGPVEGIPPQDRWIEPTPEYPSGYYDGIQDALYIVSGTVLAALGSSRPDVVAPGTGPNDGAIRNDKGQIEAVTRLVRG